AGNVAGSACACAMRAGGLDRGLDDAGMSAHAEIIVRAPDGHLARMVFLAVRAPLGDREPARVALEIGEGPVTPFRLQARERVLEAPLIVHRLSFWPHALLVPRPFPFANRRMETCPAFRARVTKKAAADFFYQKLRESKDIGDSARVRRVAAARSAPPRFASMRPPDDELDRVA